MMHNTQFQCKHSLSNVTKTRLKVIAAPEHLLLSMSIKYYTDCCKSDGSSRRLQSVSVFE